MHDLTNGCEISEKQFHLYIYIIIRIFICQENSLFFLVLLKSPKLIKSLKWKSNTLIPKT